MSKRKIYIGLDYEGRPTSVLLSDSREKADIAWAGMGEHPYRVEEIDPDEDGGVHGVAFLLTSRERVIHHYDISLSEDLKVREWKRGL